MKYGVIQHTVTPVNVTSYAEVWIEIDMEIDEADGQNRHLLRGGVD